jgi:hypothetical protein
MTYVASLIPTTDNPPGTIHSPRVGCAAVRAGGARVVGVRGSADQVKE